MNTDSGHSPLLEGVTVQVRVVTIIGHDVTIEVSFHNGRSTSVRVHKPALFASGTMEGPLFRVQRGLKDVRYIGEIIDRREPLPEDFYHLQPDETYVARLSLGQYYDLSKKGTYTVTYDDPWWLPDEEGDETFFRVRSNTVEFHLPG